MQVPHACVIRNSHSVAELRAPRKSKDRGQASHNDALVDPQVHKSQREAPWCPATNPQVHVSQREGMPCPRLARKPREAYFGTRPRPAASRWGASCPRSVEQFRFSPEKRNDSVRDRGLQRQDGARHALAASSNSVSRQRNGATSFSPEKRSHQFLIRETE